MGWDRIPDELKSIPQWVCAGADKRPLNPRDQSAASVLDPDTWGTFEDACQAGTKHIGFVLTKEIGYTIIDLDQPRNEVDGERHQKILSMFETYTERSQSGNGWHIICRGAVPEGARRDKVEVYSTARYMICTGNAINNAPINDCQDLLTILYAEIKATTRTGQAQDGDESMSDAELVEMAMRAANADKFNLLCSGDFSSYPSQSEADLALLSILAFYTRNNEQVKRIFRMSGLGKRDKAQKNDTYLNYAIKRIRANEPSFLDFDKVRASAEATMAAVPGTVTPRPISFPKGLVGEVAEYILRQAIRPVPEVALAGALGFMAGLCGRAYNVSGTGLNQYLLVLAKTGCGKEGAMTGIERLISSIRPHIPMVDQFVGPAAFASGQALIKTLDQHPSFVSVLGEFGLTLQQLSDPRANGATIMLKKVLLDLYNKSGQHNVLRSSVYSDSDKNTKVIQAPAITLLGESTPEAFFDGVSASHIAEGLIPRFTILEYTGNRPERNGNGDTTPDADLVKALCRLVTQSLTMQANRTCCEVPIDKKAQVILDEFDRVADRHINSNQSDVEAQLWNRAHLKALKLAALIAVGHDCHNPIINTETAAWAVHFIRKEVEATTAHFNSGDIGTGDSKQVSEVIRVAAGFFAASPSDAARYGVARVFHKDGIIPHLYFMRRCYSLAAFRNDRAGAANALKRTLASLVDGGVLREVPLQQMQERYGTGAKAYAYIRGGPAED